MNGVVAEKQDGEADGKEDADVVAFGNEAADVVAYAQVAANWAEVGGMTEVEVEVVLGHVLVGDSAVGSENVGLQHDIVAAEG